MTAIARGASVYGEDTRDPAVLATLAIAAPPKATNADHTAADKDADGKEELALTRTEICFAQSWSPNLFKLRFGVAAVFAVILVVFAWLGSTIGPLTEQEQFLPDEHFLQKAQFWLDSAYHLAERDNTAHIKMVWGLDELDRSECSFYSACSGSLVWSESADFDISSTANQQYLLDVCDQMRDFKYTYQQQHKCFMRGYKTWRLANAQSFPALFNAQPDLQRTAFEADLKAYLATPAGLPFAEFVHFSKDGELRLAVIEATSPTNIFAPRSEKLPEYEAWEELAASVRAASPNGMKKGFQSALLAWAWMPSEAAFVSGALNGMAIASCFAFAALLLSTGNLGVALLACSAIAGIVMSVMGCISLLGWDMGIAESVALVILVGFSVDYVVHLANSYIESHAKDRYGMMQAALQEMGISVLAGAITTLGASVFLWLCVSTFFVKFATLMMLTVGFSIIWATVYFPAIMMIFGPETDFLSLSRCCSCYARAHAEPAATATFDNNGNMDVVKPSASASAGVSAVQMQDLEKGKSVVLVQKTTRSSAAPLP